MSHPTFVKYLPLKAGWFPPKAIGDPNLKSLTPTTYFTAGNTFPKYLEPASYFAAGDRQAITSVWWNDGKDDRLSLFLAGADGQVWTTSWARCSEQATCARWTQWTTIGTHLWRAKPGSKITALSRPGSQHLDLFLTDSIGTVRSTFRDSDGAWAGWFSIPNDKSIAIGGQEVSAAWIPGTNRLVLFLVDKSGTIKTASHDSGSPWTAWKTLNNHSSVRIAVPGQPVAVLWRPPDNTHLDLFITDKHGSVVNSFSDDNGATWADWGGGNASFNGINLPKQIAPVTVLWSPDGKHLDLFVVDQHGSVLNAYKNFDQDWSSWRILDNHNSPGITVSGQPVTAVRRPDLPGHIDLFIVDKEGVVRSTYFEANGPWTDWFRI